MEIKLCTRTSTFLKHSSIFPRNEKSFPCVDYYCIMEEVVISSSRRTVRKDEIAQTVTQPIQETAMLDVA